MAKGFVIILMVVAVSLGLVFAAGCESDAQTGSKYQTQANSNYHQNGQAIGGDTGATLIGAGVGAVGGYIIGNERDKDN